MSSTRLNGLSALLDDRAGLESLRKLAEKKEVPLHRHTIWYYFGGMTLFLFAVQVITGILLLLYYRPSAEEAFESVQFIMAEVEFGWLVRSIHSWSANLMIATMFIHMFSAFLMKAYRPPRELNQRGLPKSWAQYTPIWLFLSTAKATPISVKAWLMTLEQWPGLLSQPATTASGVVCPPATFSPVALER